MDFFYEDCSEIDLDKNHISSWIERVVAKENFSLGELSFIFCSDNYLLQINQEYLKHDYYTDVITFDYSQSSIVSGDIFISLDRVRENAKQIRVSFDYELRRIIVHGVLHLCGYKDKNEEEKKVMTSKEDESLNLF